MQADSVPCAPRCSCHLEHIPAPSPPQASLAQVASRLWATMAGPCSDLACTRGNKLWPSSVFSTLAVVLWVFSSLCSSQCAHEGGCTVPSVLWWGGHWGHCQRGQACPRAVDGDSQPLTLSAP